MLREEPRDPVAAWASDWDEAVDILWLDSARAPLAGTKVLDAWLVAAGDKALVLPAALTALAVLARPLAVADFAEAACGVLRILLRPKAACWAALGASAKLILLLDSARAPEV